MMMLHNRQNIVGKHADGGSIEAIANEVEGVDFVVPQHRDFKVFLVPTAQELERLFHRGNGNCLSTPTEEQTKHFARLLNQGSSLE
jgi:hypothetical protein